MTTSHPRVKQLELPALTNSAFKHYLMASSYFLHFFGSNSENSAASGAKKGTSPAKASSDGKTSSPADAAAAAAAPASGDAAPAAKKKNKKNGANVGFVAGDVKGSEMVAMPQTRTLLEYLPFINPLIRWYVFIYIFLVF